MEVAKADIQRLVIFVQRGTVQTASDGRHELVDKIGHRRKQIEPLVRKVGNELLDDLPYEAGHMRASIQAKEISPVIDSAGQITQVHSSVGINAFCVATDSERFRSGKVLHA